QPRRDRVLARRARSRSAAEAQSRRTVRSQAQQDRRSVRLEARRGGVGGGELHRPRLQRRGTRASIRRAGGEMRRKGMKDWPGMKALMAKALAQSDAMAPKPKPQQRKLTTAEKHQKKLERELEKERAKLRHEQVIKEHARTRPQRLRAKEQKRL